MALFGKKGTGAKKTSEPTAKTGAKNSTTTAQFEFYAPDAKKVSVAGTFNEWQPDATELQRQNGGRWVANVPLAPGRYEYKFVVDGQWHSDQKPVECVPNNVGSYNCVVRV